MDLFYGNVFGIIAIACYVVVLVTTIVSFVHFVVGGKKLNLVFRPRARVSILHLSLGLFLILRIIWCCVHLYRFNQGESSYNDATFLLERIGSAVFFTSYTIVLFYWAEISGRRYVQASGFLPRLKWIFIITNIIVYLAVITFAIVCMLEIRDSTPSDSTAYDVNLYIEACWFLLISIAFFFFGIRQAWREKHKQPHETISTGRRWIVILVCTIIFTSCFLMRGLTFCLYSVLENMNIIVLCVLGFLVPEILPSLLQLLMAHVLQKAELELSDFVNSLYTRCLRKPHYSHFVSDRDENSSRGSYPFLPKVDRKVLYDPAIQIYGTMNS